MTTAAEISEPRALPTHTTTGLLFIWKLSGIDAPPMVIQSTAIAIILANMMLSLPDGATAAYRMVMPMTWIRRRLAADRRQRTFV